MRGPSPLVTRVARSGILQRRTPDAVRWRVAAASESALKLTLLAGLLVAGPVVSTIGAQGAFAIGRLAAFVAALLCANVVTAAGRGADLAPAASVIAPEPSEP